MTNSSRTSSDETTVNGGMSDMGPLARSTPDNPFPHSPCDPAVTSRSSKALLDGVVSSARRPAPGLSLPKRRKSRLTWSSAVESCELGDYVVVPLTTSSELRREGAAMHHCVGTYDLLCATGSLRVFSIRDLDGRRLATMSLMLGPAGWQLGEIKGLMNSEVVLLEELPVDTEQTRIVWAHTDLYYVAHEVVRRYQQQCRDQQTTQEIDSDEQVRKETLG